MNRLLITLMLALAFALSFASLAHADEATTSDSNNASAQQASNSDSPSQTKKASDTSDQKKKKAKPSAQKTKKKKTKKGKKSTSKTSSKKAIAATKASKTEKDLSSAKDSKSDVILASSETGAPTNTDAVPECNEANHCKHLSDTVTADDTYISNLYTDKDGKNPRIVVTRKSCGCKFGEISGASKNAAELQGIAEGLIKSLTTQAAEADKEVKKLSEKDQKKHDEDLALCRIDEKSGEKITSRTQRTQCLEASLKKAEESDDENAPELIEKIQGALGKELDRAVTDLINGKETEVDKKIIGLLMDSNDPRAQRALMDASSRAYDNLLKTNQGPMAAYYQLKAAGNYGGAWTQLNSICPMGQSSCPSASALAKAAQFAHDVGVKFQSNVSEADDKFNVSQADTQFIQRFSNPNKDGNYLLTTIGQERQALWKATNGQVGALMQTNDNPFAAAANVVNGTGTAASVDLGGKPVATNLLFDTRGNSSLRVTDQNSPWGAYNASQYHFGEPQTNVQIGTNGQVTIDPSIQLRPIVGTGAGSATAFGIQPQLSVPSASQPQFQQQPMFQQPMMQQQMAPNSQRASGRGSFSSIGDAWVM